MTANYILKEPSFFPVLLFIMLYKVVLTLKCDHSNYSYCVAFPVIRFMLCKVVLTFLLANLMFSGKGLLILV